MAGKERLAALLNENNTVEMADGAGVVTADPDKHQLELHQAEDPRSD